MNLYELEARVRSLIANLNDNLQDPGKKTVVVRRFDPSIGGAAVAQVADISCGIDWDSNLILITTDPPLKKYVRGKD
jgi:hypothetical protein